MIGVSMRVTPIRSRVSGEKMSIQVTHLQPLLQPEEELPSANDVLGIIRT